MNVSIVIPVYNEADQLAACLDAIARQTVKPVEVIVVDNNSTDETAQIASRYGFVKLIDEPRQGVLHARETGFDVAQGEIIARLDADSIIGDNWIASVQKVFTDKSVDAFSGAAQYYNVAAAPIFNAIDLFFRRRLERQLKDRVYLWGANMAIRRDAWQRVKSHLCRRGNMHEDYDIAIHLQEIGGKVIFDETVRVQVSSRRIDIGYRDFMRYVLVSPGTYAQHGVRQRWHMYEVVTVCAVGYLPARLLHRGYDLQTDKFSLVKLLSPESRTPRVDPTANVVG